MDMQEFVGFISRDDMYEERVESRFSSDCDIEEELNYIRQCRSFAVDKYFKVLNDSFHDGNLLYHMLAGCVADEFKIDDSHGRDIPSVVYAILNYYLDNEIDMTIHQWLRSDNGPIIKTETEFFKIFPEFKGMNLKESVKIANKIYDLDLGTTNDDYGYHTYVFSFSFNYRINHIDISIIRELKKEIDFCTKYGIALAQDSYEQLCALHLDNDLLNKILNSL